MITYTNPILPGFHPDPSICRVGDDYYLVNSSCEYFPCIPVFHSKDLIHWEQIGYGIEDSSKLALRKGFPNATGIYASTIRYSNGTYYIVSTNVAYGEKNDGNFLIYTKNPYEGWSDPIFLEQPGIDPSLFFDEDGKVYYTGATQDQILLCQIDIATGESIGSPTFIWAGTGGSAPEGPHLYKKDGWYYLLISEGGTEYCHMITMARSRQITGPYESCPHNPVLTNRSLDTTIKAVGHADLFQDQNGKWWAVCLGIRTITYPYKHNLGRETMLLPVNWEKDAWPVMGNNGMLEETISTSALPLSPEPFQAKKEDTVAGCPKFYDDFSHSTLHVSWNFIYNPIKELWNLKKDGTHSGLYLYGNATALSQADSLAWIGRRQEHHECTAITRLHFSPAREQEEAGLTIYMNYKHHYEIAITRMDNENYLIFRRQIGTLCAVEKKVLLEDTTITLRMDADKEMYRFSYSYNGTDFTPFGQGECAYITTEVGGRFTGNFIGLYATGNGQSCTTPAIFENYLYEGKRSFL